MKHPVTDAARNGATVHSINHNLYTALLWVVAISATIWLWQIGQLGVDFYRKHATAEK